MTHALRVSAGNTGHRIKSYRISTLQLSGGPRRYLRGGVLWPLGPHLGMPLSPCTLYLGVPLNPCTLYLGMPLSPCTLYLGMPLSPCTGPCTWVCHWVPLHWTWVCRWVPVHWTWVCHWVPVHWTWVCHWVPVPCTWVCHWVPAPCTLYLGMPLSPCTLYLGPQSFNDSLHGLRLTRRTWFSVKNLKNWKVFAYFRRKIGFNLFAPVRWPLEGVVAQKSSESLS